MHINVFQETLAVEYDEQTLAKYSVEWQPDDEHLLRVGNPRLYLGWQTRLDGKEILGEEERRI